MDGKSFLYIAKHLQANAVELRYRGAEEAGYRSIINRAYYACFLETQKLAMNQKVWDRARRAKKVNGTHTTLLKLLTGTSDRRLQQLGADLGDLYNQRCVADYKMHMVVQQTEADDAIKAARKIFKDLVAINPPSDIMRLILASLP